MFEACRRLEARGLYPKGLVVSSHPPLDEAVPANLHRLDDASLWSETVRLGGTAGEILEHPELVALLTPVLRSDYQLLDDYEPSPGAVQAPLSVCLGEEDPTVPASRIRGWQRFCTRPIRVYEKPGGHFYLNENHHSLIEVSTEPLRASRGPHA